MIKMADAASQQAIELGKERLREFLESSDTGRQAIVMNSQGDNDGISLSTLDSRGKRKVAANDGDDDDDI
jgi:CMP-2-keto-3-deoxyoctulosonic acid synthetase